MVDHGIAVVETVTHHRRSVVKMHALCLKDTEHSGIQQEPASSEISMENLAAKRENAENRKRRVCTALAALCEPLMQLSEVLSAATGFQYLQLVRSAPGGAVFRIRSTARGMNI